MEIINRRGMKKKYNDREILFLKTLSERGQISRQNGIAMLGFTKSIKYFQLFIDALPTFLTIWDDEKNIGLLRPITEDEYNILRGE